MNGQLRVGLMLGMLSSGSPQIFGQRPAASDSQPSLTIRLYNLAHVPGRTLDRASEVAGQILAEAGLTITWNSGESDCAEAHMSDMSVATAGSRPVPDSRGYVVVRLVRGGVPAGLGRGATGYALPFARQGTHVTVFYDRIEQLSVSSASMPTAGTILGAAMAHEIGHVLLGSNEHSRTGIMKACWGQLEFRCLATKGLHFTADNREVIRSCALNRMHLAQRMP
ncbi:MAG: hypothetical protein WB676_18725 [Bryobacteraceae bacterium]